MTETTIPPVDPNIDYYNQDPKEGETTRFAYAYDPKTMLYVGTVNCTKEPARGRWCTPGNSSFIAPPVLALDEVAKFHRETYNKDNTYKTPQYWEVLPDNSKTEFFTPDGLYRIKCISFDTPFPKWANKVRPTVDYSSLGDRLKNMLTSYVNRVYENPDRNYSSAEVSTFSEKYELAVKFLADPEDEDLLWFVEEEIEEDETATEWANKIVAKYEERKKQTSRMSRFNRSLRKRFRKYEEKFKYKDGHEAVKKSVLDIAKHVFKTDYDETQFKGYIDSAFTDFYETVTMDTDEVRYYKEGDTMGETLSRTVIPQNT